MKQIIQYYWNKLKGECSTDQVFYLLVMTVFFVCRKKYINCDQISSGQVICSQKRMTDEPVHFCKELFLSLFRGDGGPSFQDTIRRFSEEIKWNLINDNECVRQALIDVERDMESVLHDGGELLYREMDQLMAAILEMADKDALYRKTPKDISYLIEGIFKGFHPDTMAEFCCGVPLLGLQLFENMSRSMKRFCGVDQNMSWCDIGTILFFFHGIMHGTMQNRDLLQPVGEIEKYDFIIMDPPADNGRKDLGGGDVRFGSFNKNNVYEDWVFLMEMVTCLNENGRGAALANTGALIRENEADLRRHIVENDWLEAVITLPQNLYTRHSLGTELLIFNKNKSYERVDNILFVDISRYSYRRNRNSCGILDEGIQQACEAFEKYQSIEGLSVVVPANVVCEGVCSWKPVQYVSYDTEHKPRKMISLSQVAEITRGAQKTSAYHEAPPYAPYGRLINIKDIHNGRVHFDTAEIIDDYHYAYKEKFRVREDDILITSKGTTIKIAMAGTDVKDAFICGNITAIRVNQKTYDPYVLFEYLQSQEGRLALEKIQSGTTIRVLNNANLKNLLIPDYPLIKMKEVGWKLKQEREFLMQMQEHIVQQYEQKRNELLEVLEGGEMDEY